LNYTRAGVFLACIREGAQSCWLACISSW